MTSEAITHLFFDVGGVLGSNGWDHAQRALAMARFDLDPEFELRHRDVVAAWECGSLGWDAYLETTVFNAPRAFSRGEFKSFALAQSTPHPETIAVARRLADLGRVRLFTLNNEAAEFNLHRIDRFGLRPIFAGFLSSCWLGVRKPSRTIYERALAIAQADPARSLFIDDREENLVPARELGMRALLHTSARQLESSLRADGLL